MMKLVLTATTTVPAINHPRLGYAVIQNLHIYRNRKCCSSTSIRRGLRLQKWSNASSTIVTFVVPSSGTVEASHNNPKRIKLMYLPTYIANDKSAEQQSRTPREKRTCLAKHRRGARTAHRALNNTENSHIHMVSNDQLINVEGPTTHWGRSSAYHSMFPRATCGTAT